MKDTSGFKNGKGGNGDDVRTPFKRGERDRHVELLAKNMLRERVLKAQLKKCQEAIEHCLEDLEAGGYSPDGQSVMPWVDEDEKPETRS